MPYHVTPTRNLARIMAEGLVPRIGPRSRKLGEAVAAIYLFDGADDLQDGLDNWLWDEFPETTRLALLRVDVPEGARTVAGAAFETCLADPVPPGAIEVLHRDLGEITSLGDVLGGADAPAPAI